MSFIMNFSKYSLLTENYCRGCKVQFLWNNDYDKNNKNEKMLGTSNLKTHIDVHYVVRFEIWNLYQLLLLLKTELCSLDGSKTKTNIRKRSLGKLTLRRKEKGEKREEKTKDVEIKINNYRLNQQMFIRIIAFKSHWVKNKNMNKLGQIYWKVNE